MDNRFENYLVERNDDIDNTANALMRLLLALPEEEDTENDPFPWDMSLIGEVEEFTTSLLAEHGHLVCHPYYEGEGEIPCYRGVDCQRKSCPFKE